MHLKSLFFIIPWSLISILVLITWFSHIEFNERWLELICTFIFTSGLPIVFYLNSKRPRLRKTMLVLSFLLIIVTTISFRIKEFIHFGNGYVTQTVLYRKKYDPDIRIEFQMEDQGAIGTQMRTVKITPCLFFLSEIEETNENNIDHSEWVVVNEEVNELELKYP